MDEQERQEIETRFRVLIEYMKRVQPMGPGKDAHYCALVITDLEKLYAFTKVFLTGIPGHE